MERKPAAPPLPIQVRDVRGSELIRRLERLARERDMRVEFVPERGKGSHGTLYYGVRRATIPNIRKELKQGTLAAILRQLDLTKADLR